MVKWLPDAFHFSICTAFRLEKDQQTIRFQQAVLAYSRTVARRARAVIRIESDFRLDRQDWDCAPNLSSAELSRR